MTKTVAREWQRAVTVAVAKTRPRSWDEEFYFDWYVALDSFIWAKRNRA